MAQEGTFSSHSLRTKGFVHKTQSDTIIPLLWLFPALGLVIVTAAMLITNNIFMMLKLTGEEPFIDLIRIGYPPIVGALLVLGSILMVIRLGISQYILTFTAIAWSFLIIAESSIAFYRWLDFDVTMPFHTWFLNLFHLILFPVAGVLLLQVLRYGMLSYHVNVWLKNNHEDPKRHIANWTGRFFAVIGRIGLFGTFIYALIYIVEVTNDLGGFNNNTYKMFGLIVWAGYVNYQFMTGGDLIRNYEGDGRKFLSKGSYVLVLGVVAAIVLVTLQVDVGPDLEYAILKFIPFAKLDFGDHLGLIQTGVICFWLAYGFILAQLLFHSMAFHTRVEQTRP